MFLHYHMRILLAFVSISLLAACTAVPSQPEPEFLISAQQRETLQSVVSSVEDSAAALPRSSLTLEQVEALFRIYDEQIAGVLSVSQWQTYDEVYRVWLAERIKRNVLSAHRRVHYRRSEPTRGSGDQAGDRI